MQLTTKTSSLITFLYGMITAISNFLAAIIPMSFSTPALEAFYQTNWIIYLNEYSKVTNLPTTIFVLHLFFLPRLCTSF